LALPCADLGRVVEPTHRLADSTGLDLCGPGEWLVERHGCGRCRSWRKPHVGVDAGTGWIEAVALTTNDLNDGSQVGPLGLGRQEVIHGRARARPKPAGAV
jgi:hypothetical protein